MQRIIGATLLATATLFTNAQAEPVTSDSKYDVVVFTFEGDSGKVCDVKGDELDNTFNGVAKTFKGKSGQGSNYFDALKKAVYTAKNGTGCKEVGTSEVLSENKEINRPVGSIIVAFKDPKAALEKSNKVVNPLAAVCTVEVGKKITLETRKSEGLRAIIGIAGDGGLKCTKSKV